MQMWEQMTRAVKADIPPFNDYMLTEFREEQMAQCVERMEMIIREAMKLFGGAIEFMGSRVLSPEERLDYILQHKITYRRYNVQRSETILVEYLFKFENELYTSHMYLPYLYNGSVVINDTKYYVFLNIIERIIYRSRNSMTIKVLRSPLPFYRTMQYGYTSVCGKTFYDNLITTAIHRRPETVRKSKTKLQTTTMVYLLARFGLTETMARFGITSEQLYTTTTPDSVSEDWYVFACKGGVYLIVKKDLMADVTARRVVASLNYLLTVFKFFKHEDLYAADHVAYRVMLGKCCFGAECNPARACSQADAHLSSIESYLDPFTRAELATQGIVCTDLYDLLYQISLHMDEWLTNHSPNDLYEKKLGVIELILHAMTIDVFHRCYDIMKRKVLSQKDVRALLKFRTSRINNIYACPLVRSPNGVHDNELLTVMGKKHRYPANSETTKHRGGSGSNPINAPEHRFHPSFPGVESALTIPTSSPGVSGSINPYIEITRGSGYFVHPTWSKEVDAINKLLPSR